MKNKAAAEQILVSFTDHKSDIARIQGQVNNGWTIVSLIRNHNQYIGVMEKIPVYKEGAVRIPSKKKLKVRIK